MPKIKIINNCKKSNKLVKGCGSLHMKNVLRFYSSLLSKSRDWEET